MIDYMDLPPNVVMRSVQLGLREKVLGCQTIWLCASCETCTTRCPQEVDIARVMDTLREISLKSDLANPKMKDVYKWHELFLQSVRNNGRVFEAGAIMFFKLFRPMHLFEDMITGMQMAKKGKMSPRPHRIKNRKEIKQIFKNCSGE